jgi:hypothetical protein
MKQVITYFFAYVPGQISLCSKCEDKVNKSVTLGPVSHGLHKGFCAGCEDDKNEEIGGNSMKQVITYSFAYVPGQISLCSKCEDKANEDAPLGPVSHGSHKGYCDYCEDDKNDEEEL